MSRYAQSIPTLAAVVAALGAPAYAAPRAFVASYGNDANTATSCTAANPCRSFTAAIGVVDASGEVIAIDTAGYGAVTITKSVSLIGTPGSYAGISAASGNAVTIATAGVKVVLRNLNINGSGATNGVFMTNGATLTVDSCVVSNFTGDGIVVATAASVRIFNSVARDNSSNGMIFSTGATVQVTGSQAVGNGQWGISAYNNTASVTTMVSVDDSVASNNNWGFSSGADNGTARMTVMHSSAANNPAQGFQVYASGTGVASITVGYSKATGNGTGFFNFGGGAGATFETMNNNLVKQNGSNTTGTITGFIGT